MPNEIVTRGTGGAAEREWERAISATYYLQEVRSPGGRDFRGCLSVQPVGAVSLSRIVSTPVTYRRRPLQIAAHAEGYHLVTIPLRGDLFFEQQAAHAHCPAQCFLTERGDLPYELHQPGDNELLVVRLPESLLDGFLPRGRAFQGRTIGRPEGFAGLFIDFARSLMANAEGLDPTRAPVVARQLMELLALALSEGERGTESGESAVASAHLRRIKAAIRRRLADPDLTPARIAADCGLSVRYLHRLFAGAGTTMGRWTIEQRLAEADGALRDPRRRGSLAMVAQSHGFSDQSQFCRHYKRRFGRTPGETRAEAAGLADRRN
jgi:AraC-like DNA-binding protein